MPTIINLVLILAGSIALVTAVKLFIESSSKIARHWGVSGYTISFLIVAIATSLPEVVVGITSAIANNPILSLGNAVGSNVALLTLVISVPILLNTSPGLSTRSVLHSKDAYYTLFFSLLPIALMLDGTLHRYDGLILLVVYCIYFFIVWKRSKGVEKILEQLEEINVWKQAVVFIGSLLLLLASSEAIVRAAIGLSSGIGLSVAFIGLTITAIGTSLPELAFTIGAASEGRHQQEILGDVVGSIVANSTVVLGFTAIITPIEIVNGQFGIFTVLSFVFMLLIFLRMIKTREKIDKGEALVLLFMYFGFLAFEFYLQSIGPLANH